MFGVFSDSCPDHWGRVLMKCREAVLANRENRKPRELRDSDFLLSVYDQSRMGALRFCLDENGPFLSDDKEMSTPPWASLRTLEETARLIVKQFDREADRRIHFASAMTMLGETDGASAAENISYLDIASFIRSNGAAPNKDLKELWKRIVFNIAISNTDNHLRNHGFILTDNGWCLSPLYDVNPVPYGDNLSLNISSEDSRISGDLALETAQYYNIEENEAKLITEQILTSVREHWKELAGKYGISRSNIEYMKWAFSASDS